MTYHPEYEIGEKSPGVWKEVRRLEAEVDELAKVDTLARTLVEVYEADQGEDGELGGGGAGLRASLRG